MPEQTDECLHNQKHAPTKCNNEINVNNRDAGGRGGGEAADPPELVRFCEGVIPNTMEAISPRRASLQN